MNAIKMNRLELLAIVRKNLKSHVQTYNQAVRGYKETVLEVLEENASLTSKNYASYQNNAVLDVSSLLRLKSIPTAPQSYEKEYGRAVRMLELSVEEIIDIEEDVFNQLVLDEWSWKNNFVASASLYTKLG